MSFTTLTFQCVGPGSGQLGLPDSVTDTLGAHILSVTGGIVGAYAISDIIRFPDTVNHHAPAPSNPPSYVGGQVFSANKLSVLSPYLIEIISAVAVAAIVVRKKLT